MAVLHPHVADVLRKMAELQNWQAVVHEDDKQEYLDWLYQLDGRDQKSHALHGLYTGLAIKYKGIFAV